MRDRRFAPSRYLISAFVPLLVAHVVLGQTRLLQPEDLFRTERVGTIAWSPDYARAAVEVQRQSRYLDSSIPQFEIALVDSVRGTFRTISPQRPGIVGFFSPAWSPDNRRLVFLSVDEHASIRVWLWSIGERSPKLLTDLELRDGLVDPPLAMWVDPEHVLFLARDEKAPRNGPLYFAIERGRNVADRWKIARAGTEAAVATFDSPLPNGGEKNKADGRRIVSVDVRTGSVHTIATGVIHRPRLSADRRTLSYYIENPEFGARSATDFFGPGARGESVYNAVNWGAEVRHVDPITGAARPVPELAAASQPCIACPKLRVTNNSWEGTRLLLARSGKLEIELWRGNAWARTIRQGKAELISYKSASGDPLKGWILYPPDYAAGQKIPLITIVYPGTIYGEREPRTFDILNAQFEHPQLFAALGYGVVLPSMPEADNPLQTNALAELGNGVQPLIDALIARGIADPGRIAVLGQSAGGWATLGLITQTNTFRTAIASASYSNLESLYGSFYGQYRYSDVESPLRAQVLRMLQFERGHYGADAPPWESPERYRMNSPIHGVSNVRTPLMLVHGDSDFIPVQQAEEFFTALYRQGKRVRMVRYTGESHTISAKANILDLWRRFDSWLRETMPPGKN
jgi:Prolyl oligopeptidase family